ncbi:MAG: hypothetical protein H7146_09220, partial [Burkholderiaceae bacterium]|nr:hypothetical protein [Microbacteriaceae bacterium]
MSNLTPGVQGVMQCSTGSGCSLHSAGHGTFSLQTRVTSATPSKWRDGIVTAVTPGGWIAIALLDDAALLKDAAPRAGARQPAASATWVWNHSDLTSVVAVGEPVALHWLYSALAI